MRLNAPLVWLLLAVAAPQAHAFRIEYGADRQTELVACDRALYTGQRAEAMRCYRELLATNDDVRIKAEAARSLGDPRAANGFFQTALDTYPEDPAVRTRWGELFIETHQDNEAVRLFQESLELAPDHAPAILGLASISAGRFEDRTRAWVDEVLDLDPDNIGAHLLLARMSLEEGDIDAADARLTRALEIVEERGLPPLEIHALKASVDLLRGIEQSPWTERALEYNAGFGEIFATPAHFYVITRRYREAAELYRSAVEIQPDLWAAHAELGVNLLRGDCENPEATIAEAQRHLALAYQGDPYSAQTVNSLRLIDSFDNFALTRHDSAEGDEAAGPSVILRLHRDEDLVLRPYVLELVNRSIETFARRYGFELEEPVIVELYPEHDDFAVRTAGLPGIGLLGVTFGCLVAMDSVSARAEGDFHWGTTLWHEMAHVFTLRATNHLVPRWFSEGVSVYEEWSTGPLPGRHIPVHVLEAIGDDKLLPVAELDQGFIRPTYENQVVVSYMQAGLICEYIAANWGQRSLQAMLEHYRDGLETDEAIERALGVTAGQFDSQFERYVAEEFGAVLGNLEDWQRAQGAAWESAAQGAWDRALTEASRAIELFPEYVDDGSAWLVKSRAHEELGEDGAALEALSEYRRLGGYAPGALMRLAGWLRDAGSDSEAISVLEDVIQVAPLQQDLHVGLGDLLLEAGRSDQALTEYQVYAATNPHDQASVHLRLAKAYRALDDPDLTREHVLSALEIAPHYREAQQLLLEIVR